MSDVPITIGSEAPLFKNLRGVDGQLYSLDDFRGKRILVMMFSCNHCPYVQAYEDRVIAFQNDYGRQGVQLVAINSNEEEHYPEDSFGEMVKRAKSKGFNFPYLRDEDQTVAELFGATHTPEFFAFSSEAPYGGRGTGWRLRYHGKMDDNYQHPSAVSRKYLREAIEAILGGTVVIEPETHSIGCTIKWKL
jgi:peroxiredoxin